jgi:hypothetical protein
MKGQCARGHLIQDRSKGKQVGACIQFLRTRLFRRHVRNSAQGAAGACEVVRLYILCCQCLRIGRRIPCTDLRQAKIQNLGVSTLRHKDIRRLDVPVNNAFGVCGVQSISNVNRNRQEFFKFHRTACNRVLKCLPV